MDKLRRGEAGNVPFRSGRFFSVNGNWYFATREGLNEGPFATRQVAQAALLNFVRARSFVHSAPRPEAQLRHETGEEAADRNFSFYW